MRKTILAIAFSLLIFSNVSAGGSYRNHHFVNIDVFEQTFNFYYKSIDDTISYVNKKGKEKVFRATVNVSFYDVEKDSSFNLFEDSFNEKLVSFFYESDYMDSTNNIRIESNDNYYGVGNIRNNRNIPKREVSVNVFIITYSFETDMYTLWSCHKIGTNLKKISQFKDLDDLKVDVYNKNILTLNQEGRNLQIDRKEY